MSHCCCCCCLKKHFKGKSLSLTYCSLVNVISWICVPFRSCRVQARSRFPVTVRNLSSHFPVDILYVKTTVRHFMDIVEEFSAACQFALQQGKVEQLCTSNSTAHVLFSIIHMSEPARVIPRPTTRLNPLFL